MRLNYTQAREPAGVETGGLRASLESWVKGPLREAALAHQVVRGPNPRWHLSTARAA